MSITFEHIDKKYSSQSNDITYEDSSTKPALENASYHTDYKTSSPTQNLLSCDEFNIQDDHDDIQN